MTAVNPLSVALSGLRVAQAQIGVASNNVANVATDGYTRKVVNQYTNVIGEEGAGASVGNIERRINEILLKDYRNQTSLTSALNTRQSYMDQVQQLHGPPDAEQSITAQLSKLKNAFSQLANQPEGTYLVNNVYTEAQQTVEKFNDYAARMVELRNNAQTEMNQSIEKINALSAQIADLNTSIKVATTQRRTTADLEDQRDLAVRELSKEVDLSYFKTSDGVLTVMTRSGQLLADTQPANLYFSPAPIGAQSYYPASVSPVMLGNPTTGTDLTANPGKLGGKLGELAILRDQTLPTYQAQIDELAHKTALRFADEGLKLFTRPDSTIPADTAGAYVGFAADMVINPAIVSDKTLLRKGTDPLSTVQDGSNEVLRKIIQFTFGDVQYQKALGTTAITTGPATLFTELGITGKARATGDKNIQAIGVLDASPFINPGTEDTFTIQVGAALPQTITITAGMDAAGLVTAINTAIPGTAQLSSGGQLVLTASDDITIGNGTLGIVGLDELGLEPGVTAAKPPSFQIAAGNGEPTTITIESTDTGTELLSKLNAVPGISASLVGGVLQIMPDDGGDLTLIDGLSTPLASLGMVVSEVPHTAFRTTGLGPGGDLSTGISTATSFLDYSTQVVGLQSQNADNTDTALTSEENYRAALEKQMLDTSGVNIDEEMANLINIQAAYNASARTIGVVQQMLDELMNTIR